MARFKKDIMLVLIVRWVCWDNMTEAQKGRRKSGLYLPTARPFQRLSSPGFRVAFLPSYTSA